MFAKWETEGGRERVREEREGRKEGQPMILNYHKKTADSILTVQSKIYKSAIKKHFFKVKGKFPTSPTTSVPIAFMIGFNSSKSIAVCLLHLPKVTP